MPTAAEAATPTSEKYSAALRSADSSAGGTSSSGSREEPEKGGRGTKVMSLEMEHERPR